MLPFNTEGDHFDHEYVGKTPEQYFAECIRDYPITMEKLDDILKEFFSRGFDNGFFQGIMRGITEGNDEKNTEILNRMLEMGEFTVAQIANVTWMDEKEINSAKEYLEAAKKRPKPKKRK